MNTNFFKIAAIMLVLAGGFGACRDSQQEQDENIHLKYLGLSPCNDNLKLVRMKVDSEYIKYSTNGNRTLKIEQKFILNCCTEEIGTTINTDENAITINITDDDAGCNCICPRIANYEIVNLQAGEIYKFVFLRNGQEYHTCEILFTIHADGEIQL